jgi:hypothetical protein
MCVLLRQVLPNEANSVVVTRGSRDAAGGYTWTVTFRGLHGNVDQMVALPSLAGSGASVVVTTATEGNQLAGAFTLRLGDASTQPIAFDASAQAVQDALVAMSASLPAVTDNIVVSHDPASVDTERGRTWLVTFMQVCVCVCVCDP